RKAACCALRPFIAATSICSPCVRRRKRPPPLRSRAARKPFSPAGHAVGRGFRETGSPRAPRVPDRRGTQRREALSLDEGEPDQGRRLLQADVLRDRKPPLPPDDARGRRLQPRLSILLAHPRMGIR